MTLHRLLSLSEFDGFCGNDREGCAGGGALTRQPLMVAQHSTGTKSTAGVGEVGPICSCSGSPPAPPPGSDSAGGVGPENVCFGQVAK